MTTNYLKNSEAQKKVLTIPFGLQPVSGHLYCAKIAGASPTHQISAYNLLGEGEWNACLGAYWKGLNIPAADYDFQVGALATGMASGPQQVNSFFPADVPHSRTVAIAYKIPTGYGDEDIESTAPTGFEGIFETKKCPDFNSSGTQTGFSYSANPAREIIELLQTYARMPNLPTSYASSAAYWLSRIDWSNWVDFRDFHDQTEIVDYTTIADFEGFGLTVEYYNGVAFDTLVKKFVQQSIDINPGTASPSTGVNADNFSARFEGKIKAKYSETYTFHLQHDDGAKLWVDDVLIIDQWGTTGTHTNTAALTAGEFYNIKIEWKETTGSAQLKLDWSSSSQTQQVIPSKYLYPKAESRKLYESHIYIETPLSPGDAIRRILYQTNSIMQDVNGKLRFFCLDDLTETSFDFDNSNIDSFEFRRRDILESDPITEYEAQMKDLDLEYLDEPTTPVSHRLDNFSRKTFENVKIVNLYNCTRWQARKILETRAKLETGGGLIAEIKSVSAKTYSVMPGDLVSVEHRKVGETARDYLVKEAVDKAVSESAGSQGTQIENRTFIVQEWS